MGSGKMPGSPSTMFRRMGASCPARRRSTALGGAFAGDRPQGLRDALEVVLGETGTDTEPRRRLLGGLVQVGTEEDDRLIGVFGEDALRRLQTAGAGHALIQDDDLGLLRPPAGHGL